MWNIDVIKALVNCTSGISMGVFAVGAIVMLYDIVEARSEEKVVYMSAVTKKLCGRAGLCSVRIAVYRCDEPVDIIAMRVAENQ